MGTWDTDIFSDDIALDIKDAFAAMLDSGLTPDVATEQLEKQYLNDPDLQNLFWIAIAASQLERDEVTDRVRKHSLEVLQNGGDLERWRNEELNVIKQRRIVLDRLRNDLLTHKCQPTITPTKSTRSHSQSRKKFLPDFELGQVYAYQLPSENYILLHVVAMLPPSQGRSTKDPVMRILDWYHQTLPTAAALQTLPIMPSRYVSANGPYQPVDHFLLFPASTLDAPRNLKLIGFVPYQAPYPSPSWIPWKAFEKVLKQEFDLK